MKASWWYISSIRHKLLTSRFVPPLWKKSARCWVENTSSNWRHDLGSLDNYGKGCFAVASFLKFGPYSSRIGPTLAFTLPLRLSHGLSWTDSAWIDNCPSTGFSPILLPTPRLLKWICSVWQAASLPWNASGPMGNELQHLELPASVEEVLYMHMGMHGDHTCIVAKLSESSTWQARLGWLNIVPVISMDWPCVHTSSCTSGL